MPGDGVTDGDHDRSGGVAVEPDDASGRQRGSHRHATDIYVIARCGETTRGGKDENHEDRDGHHSRNSRQPNSLSPHRLHRLRGNRATVFNVVPEPSVDRPANGSVRRIYAVCVPRLGSQQGPNRVRAIRWSMKAARLFSYDKPLKIVDVDAPRIKNPSEVLVRVTGAGVCHTDLHIVEGVWREKVQVNLPYTLGHENAGVVQEVGDAVTSFKKGEKVIVHPVITDGTCRPCRIGEDMHCENLVFPGITADGGFA